jgi:hypothetical protein
MPRSVEEILQHADELDLRAVALLREAIQARSSAERSMIEAVRVARQSGMTWSAIGTFIGTSGEAARQRYAHKVA